MLSGALRRYRLLHADVAQLVEHQLPKLRVAGSNPVVRFPGTIAQTRGVGGTGLGLYIGRELLGQMGARIWVDARAGGGSTFVVELPPAG